MTQAELADELAPDHGRLSDLIDRFYTEDVKDRYEMLLGSIADRFSNAGLSKHETTFRPSTGIALTYGSWNPGLALARMQGHASRLDAIIEELRRNPKAKLQSKRPTVSHDCEDVADDLDPFLAQLRDILAKYPNGPNRRGEDAVRQKIAARFTQSGLRDHARIFQPTGVSTGGDQSPDFRDNIGRRISDLDRFISSMREDPASWRVQIEDGLGVSGQPRPAVTDHYVNPQRIEELERLNPLVEAWDLSGMIQLCVEINNAYATQSWLSLGMCVRALMNHIPQLFFPDAKEPTFSQVASQAPTSIKKSMTTLEGWRPIPDWVNHNPIRKHVSLPKPQQMDVKAHLDVLLGYVIEKLKKQAATG